MSSDNQVLLAGNVSSKPAGAVLSATFIPAAGGGDGTCYMFNLLPKEAASKTEHDSDLAADTMCNEGEHITWDALEGTYDSKNMSQICSLARVQANGVSSPCGGSNKSGAAISFTAAPTNQPDMKFVCARPRGVGRVANMLAKTPAERSHFARLLGWDQGAMQDPHFASGLSYQNSMVNALDRISKGETAEDVFTSNGQQGIWQRAYWNLLVDAYNMYNTDPKFNGIATDDTPADIWHQMSCGTNFNPSTAPSNGSNMNYHANTWHTSGAKQAWTGSPEEDIGSMGSSCEDITNMRLCDMLESCSMHGGKCKTNTNI